MFEKFFMPDTDDDTAREKWNNLNRQVNRENAADYKIPIESVRYKNKERVALDRVGELSSYNGKIVMAIIESEKILTVYTKENGLLRPHIIEKYDKLIFR